MENNKVGNFFYNISHRLYVQGNQNGDIYAKEITITKNEIIKETPKKFKVKFSVFESWNGTIKTTTKEKLYDKDSVNVEGIETIEQIFKKIDKYINTVKESDRIPEYKKKAILEEFDNINKNKEEIKNYFKTND